MKKNILLFQPRIGDMDMFRDKPTPPMGLLCACSLASQKFEIRLLDQRINRDWKKVLKTLIDDNTIAIGISIMTGGMISHALKAASEIRRLTKAPLIWGGVHPSLLPEQTVLNKFVDYVIAGEGEEAFAKLVEKISINENADNIPGVWTKSNARIKERPEKPLLDMNNLPGVPHHLVDMEKYVQTYRGKRMFFYQASRGCPCRCSYCYNKVFNLGLLRSADIEKVLRDLKQLKDKYEFSLVYFLDDNFLIDKKRALTILRGLKELGLGSVLQGVDIESLNRLSDEELDFLEASGVERIAIGVESGSNRIRNNILKKEGSVELARRQLIRFKNRKIIVLFSLMIGLPSETADEIKETVKFGLDILKMGPNFRIPQFYIFSPYPGTLLFEELKREGVSFPSKLEAWGKYEWDYSHMHEKNPGIKDFLERVGFLSKFLDSKFGDYGSGKILKIIYDFYRPIAWFRLSRGLMKPLPEKFFYSLLKKIFA
ncbi:MAG: B12-binding domain-containing radical SAM protein [Elusimicrobiales bacterium]|nr:B12-binding domain-containing radical SAM protein [Elusimicrobiales bacterium]